CRSHNLQNLEILRASDLAVLYAGGLQNGIALANGSLTLPLILKSGPAVQDVDELEGAVVNMPLLHLVLHLLAVVANEVRDEVALGAALDAEITILENLAQSGRPLRIASRTVHEIPFLRGHLFLRVQVAHVQYSVARIRPKPLCLL